MTAVVDARAELHSTDALVRGLRACVGDSAQVRDGELDRHALASDASHFLLLPQALVTPRDADEVARLLQASGRQGFALTFRSGAPACPARRSPTASWSMCAATSSRSRCSTAAPGCACNPA